MKPIQIATCRVGNFQGIVIPKVFLAQIGIEGHAEITIERDALVLHGRLLALHGGAGGVRGGGLLQSALARPQQQYSYAEDAYVIDMTTGYTQVSCATILSLMATSVHAS